MSTHYIFEDLGQAVLASETAHIAIPIKIDNVAKQIEHTKDIANHLHQMAKFHSKSAPDGHILLTLSRYCDDQVKYILEKNRKLKYFYTKPSKDVSSIFETLLTEEKMMVKRQAPLYRTMPNPESNKIRNFKISQQNLNYNFNKATKIIFSNLARGLNIDEEEIPVLYKKMMTEKDDKVTTTITEATPTTSSTTLSPGVLDLAYYWGGQTVPNSITSTTTMSTSTLSAPSTTNNDYFDDWSNFTKTTRRERYYQQTLNDITHGPQEKRVKRQLLIAGLISLATSVGIGSIFGAVDNEKLDKIRTSLHNTEVKQRLIVHSLAENSAHIVTNQKSTHDLAVLALGIKKFTELTHFELEGTVLFILLNSEFEQIHRTLDTFVEILEAAQVHNFHPGTLTVDGSEAVFSDIKGLAAQRGLEPVIQTAQQLSQCSTHFFLTNTPGLTLVVEVPLVNEQNLFSLHKYTALPISIGQKVFARIVPENPILAIGSLEPTGHPRFVELSSTDLGLCRKLGKLYLCTELRIISKPSQHSCLYSLYMGEHKAAQLACRLSLEPRQQDQVVSVSPDKFIHYSATPTTYMIKCQNGSTVTGLQLLNFTEITIPDNCYAETSHFILLKQNDIEQGVIRRIFHWTLSDLSFFANDTSIEDLEQAAAAVRATKGAPPFTTETVKAIQDLNQPIYEKPFPFATFILAASASFGFTILIGFIVYRACQARNNVRRQHDPIYKLSEFLSASESNAELLTTFMQQHSSSE